MNSLKEKIVDISTLIERQLPSFVAESNPKFVSFLSSYYESQESRYGYLDVVKNFIEYYNIGYYHPNRLIESTLLSTSINASSTTISVDSTIGFPEKNGYVSIDDEIIFYRTKTQTQFVDCVRGTSAFVLENSPFNQISYNTGSAAEQHTSRTKVINLGYSFVMEFLRRIRSEISPTLPEVLTEELNISSFLKNIKSFYLSKGSEQSHQLFFRILFNDKKLKLKLVPGGKDAKIEILNYGGDISAFQLVSGGLNYYYEVDNLSNLVSPPIIDILGSGTGSPNQLNQVPTSAQMVVTGMNSSGTITSVQVVNAGQNYIGPITARVRDRSFTQGQKIINQNANGVTTGSARVDSWDPRADELLLTEIIGYFRIGDRIIGEGGENPRSFIAKAYPITDINKEGNPSIETISQDPTVEYPKNYLIKPSAATYYEKKVIRCELLQDYSSIKNLDNVDFIELVQSRDITNKIPGTSLDISEITRVKDNVYEFEIDTKLNYKKLYLPSSTTTTQSTIVTSSSSSTITVNSTFNFPQKKGRLFVNNKIIRYESRTSTQFINCTLTTPGSLTVSANTNIFLYGRECLTAGEVSYFIKGYVNGDRNTTPIIFRLHALPSQPIIADGGSLYHTNVFELNPETTYKLNKTVLTANKYNYGEINSVIIENKGINYKVNDKLVINNDGNLGSGFNAQIASVEGKAISSYQLSTINERAVITFTTSAPHGLATKDKVKFNNFLDTQTVYSIVSSTQFSIENVSNLSSITIAGLTYITNSRTASGSIDKIIITNKGKNYSSLPEVTGILTQNGYGALIQLNSDNIGKISKFEYSSIGNELIGNKLTQYPVVMPTTAKITNNFQIASILVKSGGLNYNPITDVVKVNGVVDPNCQFKVITSSGIVTEVQVIKGGFNFSSIPTITIDSAFGVGAVLEAKIKRKILEENDILSFVSNGSSVTCRVIHFDVPSSTVEYYPVSGTISENDIVYTKDGNVYGNIISIKTASAYCTPSPYTSYSYKFLDNFGFVSDSTQRIIDSNYYQDWAYTLVSQRNTSEWKSQVIQNTHPAGYKVFGKYRVENTTKLSERQEDSFNSSVLFKATLSNVANLNLKLSNCTTQTVYVDNYSAFSVGDFVFGNFSGTVGLITLIKDNYIEIQVLNNKSLLLSEYLFTISRDFACLGIDDTNSYFIFYSGILQTPRISYYISDSNFIPSFNLNSSDEIISHELDTPFTIIDYVVDNNKLILTKDDLNFVPNSYENLLISINGVVQAPTYTLSGNIVTLSQTIQSSDSIFILYHEQLKALTFSGSGTTYSINYSPSSSCNVLLFTNSVCQSQLLTDFSVVGNQVVLSESINVSNIFGWYIDETISCYIIDPATVNANKILQLDNCIIKKVTQYIESNSVKTQDSVHKITKTLLNGTVYSGTDTTTVYGLDTKFKYTSPEYSTSYVEVLNKITFDGSSKTFNLTYADGLPYTPVNGENSLLVNINNQVLDHDQYTLTGSSITFVQTYNSTDSCTVIDFNSKYLANTTNFKSAILDRLNVAQNGSRQIFNLSDRGVPQYIANIGDVFVIKNGILSKLTNQSHTISNNKITFTTAPSLSDVVKLAYFNRQLEPEKTKNVLLDSFGCLDGTQDTFPLSINGILFTPISAQHLVVILSGVHQKPGIDFTITGSSIQFANPLLAEDQVSVYYSYDGLNQNFAIDSFRMYNGIETRFGLTSNYVSSSVYSSSHLQVIKNGLYQYPEVDYTIEGLVDARNIKFTIPPTSTDTIDIVNYSAQNLVNITNRFTQLNPSSLQYTSQSPTIDTTVFLVYVNGILQVGNSWSFNSSTNILSFANFVSLTLDEVCIIAFTNPKRVIDPITFASGTNTYNLTISGSTITTDLPATKSDLILSLNGTEAISPSLYSISGSTITLLDPSLISGDIIYIYQIGSSTYQTQIVDNLNDDYSKSTYKLQVNYKSFNPPSASDIFVLRNGVVQNPIEDFTITNGSITFTTNITAADNIYLDYRHGSSKINISNVTGVSVTLSTTILPSQYKDLILYINGAPQFYENNFTISGNVVTLSSSVTIDSIFAILYAPITYIDSLVNCPDGVKTKFRLLYNNQNLIQSDIVEDADVLVSVNGVIQYPGVQYTITPNRGQIEFLVAPQETDDIFMIRMYGNKVINLTSVSGSNTVYNLSQQITSPEQENLVIFSNNTWKFDEINDYTYTTTSRITLSSNNTSTYVFGIKFAGIFHLLDQIHRPYNGINTKFNLFLNQENFVPPGTIENDSTPSDSSIVVIKNGKILDPGVDYTLDGDIKSQITFTTAPIQSDIISVKCVGSFMKLLSITSGFGGKVYDLKTQTNSPYYPNANISRPRPHENQIIVIKDGNIQSPLYDYYIDNNQLVFNSNTSATKIVVLDFKGSPEDMKIDNVYYQVNIGDKIFVDGETTSRTVTQILSPTVLKTASYSGTSPSGFDATSTLANGKLSGITITNGGTKYRHPVILRTIGSGYGAKATAPVNYTLGGKIESPVTIQYPGYNQYAAQRIVPTSYIFAETQTPLSTSNIRIGTKLASNITSTTEIIPLSNAQNFEESDISINITSSTGSSATFRPFISNGRIRKVEVITQGIGYDDRDVALTIVGGGGSGCVLKPVLDAMGRVISVQVKNSGEGYDTFRVIISTDVIEYTNIISNQLVGCTRLLSSTTHNQGDVVYFDKFI
jgi:hypothetical protein